ncbi:MAG: hypothetical protein AB8G95_28300, partial [Anaerolineae bacterium]
VTTWEPALRSLTNGDRSNSATITPDQVELAANYLDQLAEKGSPALQTMLQRQRDQLGDLDQYIGMTVLEASEAILGSKIYLPIVTESE